MNVMVELPLILFTLLIQLGTGAMLAAQLLPPVTAASLRGQSFWAFCFVAAGAIISLAHIGTPPAPVTILHSFSWLTIQLLSVLVLCVVLGYLAWLRKKDEIGHWENFLAWLAVGLGFWLIFVMSRTYVSPFLPAWQRFVTFFLFCASTMILGAMWTAMTLACKGFSGPLSAVPTTYGRLLFIALSGLVLLGTFIPLALPVFQGKSALAMIASIPGIALWHSWHGALSGFGVLIFMTGIYRRISTVGRNPDLTIPGLPTMGLAFTLAMLGEISGRVAFYLSYAWQPM